jgi:hypothetical protein
MKPFPIAMRRLATTPDRFLMVRNPLVWVSSSLVKVWGDGVPKRGKRTPTETGA